MLRYSTVWLVVLLLAPLGRIAFGQDGPEFNASFSSTRIGFSADEDNRYSTIHEIGLTYSGVAFNSKPTTEGSLSFGASIDSRVGGGELNLFGGYFINDASKVYNPELVPFGLSYGAGLWLSDSQMNSVDIGGLARVEKLWESPGGQRPGLGIGLEFLFNDQVQGRSSPLTTSLGGYLNWKHGETRYDTFRLSLDVQHRSLDSETNKPSDAVLGIAAFKYSSQLLLPSLFVEMGLGAYRVYDDPLDPGKDNSTVSFISGAIVFRLPKNPAVGIAGTGMTKIGGSAYGANFWDTWYQ